MDGDRGRGERLQKAIDDLEEQLTALAERARRAGGDLRRQLRNDESELRRRLDETRERLREVRDASGEGWEEVKSGLERLWTDVKEAWERSAPASRTATGDDDGGAGSHTDSEGRHDAGLTSDGGDGAPHRDEPPTGPPPGAG
jgi:hypothetical protein